MRAMHSSWWLLSAVQLATASDPSTLRGVGPEFEKYYAGRTFSCISNPSISLPSSKVNDDYCDCPDGSDEPGTAACGHLSPLSPPVPGNTPETNITPALPGFYCHNHGHNPEYVPFTLVNDGICDYSRCCDGSDEWAGVGGIKCANKCKEIGKKWREMDQVRRKASSNAFKRHAQLITEAAGMEQDLHVWLRDAEGKQKSLEASIAQLERERDEIEKKERSRLVKGATKGQAGVLAGLAKARLGELREALKTVRKQRNSYQDRATQLEGILQKFREEHNPNFNDEGVKRAVNDFNDYQAKEKESHAHANFEDDLSNFTGGNDGITWEEFEAEPESDIDVLYAFEEYLPVQVRDWIDQKLRELKLLLIDNGIIAAPKGSDEESKAVKAAKDKVSAVQRDLDSLKREKEDKKKALSKDFGKAGSFRPLQEKCVQKDSGEYTYELCWMGSVNQISKKGGSRNSMGNFKEFGSTIVDEETTADGKGLGAGERVTMKYDQGAHCWQGPQRSTTVVLACAEEEEIWKVMEEEKCVYRIEAGTAAVCDVGAGEEAADVGRGRDAKRDEL